MCIGYRSKLVEVSEKNSFDKLRLVGEGYNEDDDVEMMGHKAKVFFFL